jgi:hypothetical protein
MTIGPKSLTVERDLTILEDGDLPTGVLLRYKGVALIDHILSDNDVYYSPGFNTQAMESTNEFMALGGKVTVYSRHGGAVQRAGALPTGLPVGRVDRPLQREGPEIVYEAAIADTAEGRDVAALIRSTVLGPTSVRFRPRGFEAERMVMEGKNVLRPSRGLIKGIDLAEDAGIPGAGIVQIFEEAPLMTPFVPPEEDNMDWKEVTLKELEEHVPTLLEESRAETVGLLEAAQGALASALEAATAAEALRGDDDLNVAILEASMIGVSREIRARLIEKCTKVEDIKPVLEEVRLSALNTFMVSQKKPPEITTKGDAHPDKKDDPRTENGAPLEESDGDDPTPGEKVLSPEEVRILELVG